MIKCIEAWDDYDGNDDEDDNYDDVDNGDYNKSNCIASIQVSSDICN